MSRALIKENDLEHASIDIPERPLINEHNFLSPNLLNLLNKKFNTLYL
jgi:transcription elongation factor GreB